MRTLQATTFDDIVARAARTKAVYDALTPEQKQEVDEYNKKLIAAVQRRDHAAVKAMPVSPMVAHMDKALK